MRLWSRFAIRSPLLGLLYCAPATEPSGPKDLWAPGEVRPAPAATVRGLIDRRGLIHAHSVYSHDACDGEPVKDGVRDPVCFDDFRRGLCQVQHDFVMLTDHKDAFVETEYPEVLLYRSERGDVLVERENQPVASWLACEDGRRALVLGGAEAAVMPVGLEHHLGDLALRESVLSDASASAIEKLHQAGAVALLAHTEDWTAEQLVDLPLDGFEMFNLHANTLLNAGAVLELLFALQQGTPALPHPDLIAIPILSEDPRYLKTWSKVLASGQRRVTTMGTDCHRNTFQAILADGERVDSYRRMMLWFSNHLLIRAEPDGTWDDRHLKDALRSGRLYGAFEVFGYPVGFELTASASGTLHEMGEEVPLAARPELVVEPPTLRDLDPAGPAPGIEVLLLQATDDGWKEVARSTQRIAFSPSTPGAYRAEVRIRPRHLEAALGGFAEAVLSRDHVWILSNPIYIR